MLIHGDPTLQTWDKNWPQWERTEAWRAWYLSLWPDGDLELWPDSKPHLGEDDD